jgi:ribonucleotide monophosphatase NagD (HAD superfamily)
MGDEGGRDMQQWYDRRKKSKSLRCDGLIVDLDDVIWRGGEPIEGAADAIAAIRATGCCS